MKSWQDVYQLPLRLDKHSMWVYDSKDQFVFEFLIEGLGLAQKIVDTINGEHSVNGRTSKFVYHHQDQVIRTDKGVELISIRGYGNLTGKGAHNLSHEEASNIKDTLAEFIISKINP